MRYWYSPEYRKVLRPQGSQQKPTNPENEYRRKTRVLIDMRRVVMKTMLHCVLLGLLVAGPALATPSTTYWTPCTIDIQPAGVTHIGVDNYFGVGRNDANRTDEFATDIGPEWGAQITPKLAMEFGFDVLSSPVTTPFFLNAKIGYRENTISKSAPAVQLGFVNFGTKRGTTNNEQDIVCLMMGKTLPDGKTRLMASYYYGNPASLKSSTGATENTGYMVAMDYQLVPGKWVLAADYSSGKNAFGGGGVGVYYYFTKDISLLTGPVWFNDKGLNGSVKATMQLDINL